MNNAFKINVVKMFYPLIVLMLAQCLASAQPVWQTKQMIAGRSIVKDAKQKNRFYYGPGALRLTTDKEDKPVFQLVAMRYTGTTLTNDKEEKRFTNLLMFSVTMEAMTAALLKEIKTTLPANAILGPLPIRHLESVIVSGVGTPGNDTDRMRKHTGSQQDGGEAPGVYWTERTFTVPLDNHDAQILWDQVENGRLVMSLNYAFYANMLVFQEESLQVSGDSAFVHTMTDAVENIQRDTDMVSQVVLGDVLNISIDPKKYPELLKKIDINAASIPPAYAAFEVKCYDFELGIRPDIAFKTVEIEGESVTGVPVKTKVKFSSKQPDITGKFASFPYPVKLDKPIRFRIVETPFETEPITGTWKTMEQFSNLIDASTQQKKNPLAKRCIDLEILPEYMADKNLNEAVVHLVYQYEGKQQIKSLTFNKADAHFFDSTCITFEQEIPIKYMVAKKYADGRKTKGILKATGKDDYILVR